MLQGRSRAGTSRLNGRLTMRERHGEHTAFARWAGTGTLLFVGSASVYACKAWPARRLARRIQKNAMAIDARSTRLFAEKKEGSDCNAHAGRLAG